MAALAAQRRVLDQLVAQLASQARAYPVRASNIELLPTPESFYDSVLASVHRAKRRLAISTLYLGTGSHEQTLVNVLGARLREQGPSLRARFVLDYLRGTRGRRTQASSVDLLQPLVSECSNLEVSLFHTPLLRGALKTLLPERANEIIGVQHIKAVVSDDDVILTGANLSDNYFTNRQDRYIVLRNVPQLASFYDDLIARVADLSFRLERDGALSAPTPQPSDIARYAPKALELLGPLASATDTAAKSPPPRHDQENDTWVFPTVQLAAVGVRQDQRVTSTVLQSLSAPDHSAMVLSSPYFNITDDYRDLLLSPHAHAHCTVVTASPRANGFFGSSGASGYIPAAYVLMEQRFLDAVSKAHKESHVVVSEYTRSGWSFHAKGLWWKPPNESTDGAPVAATIIGSSNLGRRSIERDLESQIVLTTTNPELQKKLSRELDSMLASTKLVAGPEHFAARDYLVPWWLELVAWAIGAVL